MKFISNMHFTQILYTILHHFFIIQLNNISINLSINLCTLWIAKWLLNVTGLVFFYSWQLHFSCTASLLALGVDELLTLEKRSTVFMYIYQYFAMLYVWKWVCSFWKLKYIVFYCAICETFFVFLVSNWGCTETNGERKGVTEEVWRTAIQKRCSDLWQLMIRTTTWWHLTDATLLWWHIFVSCDIAVVTWPMTCDSFWLQTQNRYYIS